MYLYSITCNRTERHANHRHNLPHAGTLARKCTTPPRVYVVRIQFLHVIYVLYTLADARVCAYCNMDVVFLSRFILTETKRYNPLTGVPHRRLCLCTLRTTRPTLHAMRATHDCRKHHQPSIHTLERQIHARTRSRFGEKGLLPLPQPPTPDSSSSSSFTFHLNRTMRAMHRQAKAVYSDRRVPEFRRAACTEHNVYTSPSHGTNSISASAYVAK